MKRARDEATTMPDMSRVVSGLAAEFIEMLGSGEARMAHASFRFVL